MHQPANFTPKVKGFTAIVKNRGTRHSITYYI